MIWTLGKVHVEICMTYQAVKGSKSLVAQYGNWMWRKYSYDSEKHNRNKTDFPFPKCQALSPLYVIKLIHRNPWVSTYGNLCWAILHCKLQNNLALWMLQPHNICDAAVHSFPGTLFLLLFGCLDFQAFHAVIQNLASGIILPPARFTRGSLQYVPESSFLGSQQTTIKETMHHWNSQVRMCCISTAKYEWICQIYFLLHHYLLNLKLFLPVDEEIYTIFISQQWNRMTFSAIGTGHIQSMQLFQCTERTELDLPLKSGSLSGKREAETLF